MLRFTIEWVAICLTLALIGNFYFAAVDFFIPKTPMLFYVTSHIAAGVLLIRTGISLCLLLLAHQGLSPSQLRQRLSNTNP